MDEQSRRMMLAEADHGRTLRTSAIARPTSRPQRPSPPRTAIRNRYPGDYRQPHIGSTSKGVLIGLLSAFGSLLVVVIVLGLIYLFKYTSRGRILLDRLGRSGEFDDEQAFAREEAEALEEMDDMQRAEYMRAKAFTEANPAESAPTDISLSQFLAIQEKGVSAWEFEPALEIANCFVEGRTEIEFFDTECSVQTNLPVPKQNEVYYWEAKIFDKPDTTQIGVGMTTKPYPLFRMPGYHKTSVAYLSPGVRRFNQPFTPFPNYGPPYVRGDVVGVGYRPRSGTVFFTRNGKKLDDITHTLKSQNLFPTVGASGPATIHVNFGQMGFVYIEANVKKWGLAPASGSLAPPPPYGSEQGSILLDQGQHGIVEGQGGQWSGSTLSPSRHGRTRSAQVRLARNQVQRSPGPQRSPTDISLTQLEFESEDGEGEDDGFRASASVPTEPEDIPSLPQNESQQGLGLLDVSQPPPEYSSPVDRSMHFPGHRSSPRHPPRTSSRRQPSSTSQQPQDKQRRRKHHQRQDYFDVSSPSSSERSALDPSDEEGEWEPYHDDPDPEQEPAPSRQRSAKKSKKRKGPTYNTSDRDLERQATEDASYQVAAEGEESGSSTPRPSTSMRSPAAHERSPPVPYEVAVGEATPDGSRRDKRKKRRDTPS